MSSNKTVIAVDAMEAIRSFVVVPERLRPPARPEPKFSSSGTKPSSTANSADSPPPGSSWKSSMPRKSRAWTAQTSPEKNASIQVACRLVRDGAAQGVVSAGHSGASVACGMFIMGRIPGVERPALASLLPTEKEPVVLLDVGATVDCKPYNIFQFGLMGNAFARDILNKETPRVGLLSIGEEEGKGNNQVKEAYELFKLAQNLNFTGNIEGRDLFTGDVDVAVCDGFVGNVALKLSEGLGMSLSRVLKRELLNSGILPKLGSLLAKSAFKRFAKVVDYAEYGGAPLLGLQNISIVCHGRSNSKAICSATRMATLFVEKETNQRLMEAICANEELTRYGRSC